MPGAAIEEEGEGERRLEERVERAERGFRGVTIVSQHWVILINNINLLGAAVGGEVGGRGERPASTPKGGTEPGKSSKSGPSLRESILPNCISIYCIIYVTHCCL